MYVPDHLKQIIFIRHADWMGPDHELTEEGREQATLVGQKLQSAIQGRAILVCSFNPEALKTAEIILQHTQVDYQDPTGMANEYYAACVLDFSWVNDETVETVVVVGHDPDIDQAVRRNFTEYVAQETWGSERRKYSVSLGYGEGVIVQLSDYSVKTLRLR